MESQKFDDITKALANGASRRRVLKGIVAGALGAFGARRATTDAAPTCRTLGEACKPGPTGTEQGTCCASNADGSASHLFCQKVAATGADRCECETGFIACNGECVSIACPGGGQLDTTTCTCVCPTGTDPCGGNCLQPCPTGQSRDPDSCLCECPNTCIPGAVQASDCTCSCPTGTIECGGACVSNICPTGQTFNLSTCSCVCANACIPGAVQASDCTCSCPTGTEECNDACVSNVCPSGQVFIGEPTCACGCPSGTVSCGGACHNPTTECAGLHNKIFNVDCCNRGFNPCQNPGQPSGKCKA